MIFVVSLYFYHTSQGKHKPLQRLIFLVLYHDDGLVNMSLPMKSQYVHDPAQTREQLTNASSSPIAFTAPEMYVFKAG